MGAPVGRQAVQAVLDAAGLQLDIELLHRDLLLGWGSGCDVECEFVIVIVIVWCLCWLESVHDSGPDVVILGWGGGQGGVVGAVELINLLAGGCDCSR